MTLLLAVLEGYASHPNSVLLFSAVGSRVVTTNVLLLSVFQVSLYMMPCSDSTSCPTLAATLPLMSHTKARKSWGSTHVNSTAVPFKLAL